MARSLWKGAISFGLVNIPVKIYTATEEREIAFNLLCKKGHKIEMKRWCPEENREVKWDEVKKGYKVAAEKYIAIEKEDLKKLALKTTKTIDVQEFIDLSQIDPILFEKSYYVVPEENAEKAYSLFVEALRLTNKVAIGKVVFREKEHLVALRAYKKGIVMHLLHFATEIKPIEKLAELEKHVKVSAEELKLAEALIDKLAAEEFRLEKFHDEYTEALKRLIKAKLEGKEFAVEEKPVEAAKSLMEALKASVEAVPKRRKASV
jgi:DNA end-binding protein Ku